MENSIYLGLSKQLVLRHNMDTIANNIANMNTTGYRTQNLLFEEFISDPRGNEDELSFVYDRGQYHNTEPGGMAFTGNSLDVGLEGPGYIGVQGPGGELMYTRAGDFHMDVNGRLLSSAGFAIADQGGSDVIIPPDSTEILINDTGGVFNQNGQVGQIMITEFENVQALKPAGNNMYSYEGGLMPPNKTRMQQGNLEGSNVKPVIEITRMIDTLRTYQSVNNVLQSENERLRTAVQRLTRQ